MASHELDIRRARPLARSRQPVSPLRQSEGRLRTFALDLGPSIFAPPLAPGYAQLVTVRRGAGLLHCAEARVVLTSAHAAWVPERTPYALELHTRCELRVLYAESKHYDRAFSPVRPTSLLVELIERVVVAGYLDPSNVREARLLSVLDDELVDLAKGSAADALISPRDPHLLAAVNRALEDGDDVPPIAALACFACMSVRTFERRFRRETGLTPREWLCRARLARAAMALASGATVTEAALGCGYASLSAFVAAFRRTFGVSPGRAALRRAGGENIGALARDR